MELINKRINKILNNELECPSYEMALPRKKVIDKIKEYSEIILEHIIKCVVYGKSLGEANYFHWKNEEICGYCKLINEYEVKKSKKLKEDAYIQALLENNGTAESDYYSEVVLFGIRNSRIRRYPDFKPTKEQGHIVYLIFLALIFEVAPVFADYDKINDYDFTDCVNKAFRKVGLD